MGRSRSMGIKEPEKGNVFLKRIPVVWITPGCWRGRNPGSKGPYLFLIIGLGSWGTVLGRSPRLKEKKKYCTIRRFLQGAEKELGKGDLTQKGTTWHGERIFFFGEKP